MSDLARQLGLSKATVCRALKDDRGIAPETRRRVQAEASRRGYHPNPLLSAIAQRRWMTTMATDRGRTIAYISMLPKPSEEHPEGRYLAGAMHRANERGYDISMYLLSDYKSGRQLSRILFSRGVQGIIVGPIRKPNQPLSLEWSRFSAVSCGGDFYPPPLHKVQVNQNQLATLAFRVAVEHGYKRIGVALSFHEYETPDDAERLGAFTYEQLRFANRLPTIPILTSSAKDDFVTWFHQHKPDLVIGLSIRQYNWLRDLNIAVPEEVGFLALLNTPSNPTIAYIDNLERDVGILAVDYLESLIRSNELGIPKRRRFIFTETELHMGSTIKMIPSNSQRRSMTSAAGPCARTAWIRSTHAIGPLH